VYRRHRRIFWNDSGDRWRFLELRILHHTDLSALSQTVCEIAQSDDKTASPQTIWVRGQGEGPFLEAASLKIPPLRPGGHVRADAKSTVSADRGRKGTSGRNGPVIASNQALERLELRR
jgi:hypothetical protein